MEFRDYISPDDSFNCSIKLFDRKIDLCRISDSLSSNVIISLVVKAIESSLNFKLGCPIEARSFHLKYVLRVKFD